MDSEHCRGTVSAAVRALALCAALLLVPETPIETAGGKAIGTEMYTVKQVGARYTAAYRAYVRDAAGRIVSPFHDIPLRPHGNDAGDAVVNMVVEVPRHSQAKLEISKDEPLNPIKQDVKKGALRFVRNVFPYHGYIWHYGAIPQTWEAPDENDGRTGLPGDNDPLDVLDISAGAPGHTGQVKAVKVLGALAMIDEGETDWKILAVDTSDPLAAVLHDACDIETHCPGLLDATRRWFALYKVPDGKPRNSFAFDGAVLDRAAALDIIAHTHASWARMLAAGRAEHAATNAAHNISLLAVGPQGASKGLRDVVEAVEAQVALPDADVPASVADVFFPEAMLERSAAAA